MHQILAALTFQGASFIVGVLMIPLFLRYLTAAEFVLWFVFTTIGGLSLQIENALQTLAVRRLARQIHTGSTTGVAAEIVRTRRQYRFFALFVFIILNASGVIYLSRFSEGMLLGNWLYPWLIFMTAYAVNYLFGPNNCILLSTAWTIPFNYVNTITRIIYFIGTVLLLHFGYGVFGIASAFALSVAVGCTAMSILARRVRVLDRGQGHDQSGSGVDIKHIGNANDILKYLIYTISAFLIYRGSFLVAALHYTKDVTSSYSLLLQIYVICSTASLVPLQVRLGQLMESVVNNDHAAAIRELRISILFAIGIFALAMISMTQFGHFGLRLLQSDLLLPNVITIIIVGGAFLIEALIMNFTNFLLVQKDYRFVKIYGASVAINLVLITFGVWRGWVPVVVLAAVPMVLQLSIVLPILAQLAGRKVGLSGPRLIGGLFSPLVRPYSSDRECAP